MANSNNSGSNDKKNRSYYNGPAKPSTVVVKPKSPIPGSVADVKAQLSKNRGGSLTVVKDIQHGATGAKLAATGALTARGIGPLAAIAAESGPLAATAALAGGLAIGGLLSYGAFRAVTEGPRKNASVMPADDQRTFNTVDAKAGGAIKYKGGQMAGQSANWKDPYDKKNRSYSSFAYASDGTAIPKAYVPPQILNDPKKLSEYIHEWNQANRLVGKLEGPLYPNRTDLTRYSDPAHGSQPVTYKFQLGGEKVIKIYADGSGLTTQGRVLPPQTSTYRWGVQIDTSGRTLQAEWTKYYTLRDIRASNGTMSVAEAHKDALAKAKARWDNLIANPPTPRVIGYKHVDNPIGAQAAKTLVGTPIGSAQKPRALAGFTSSVVKSTTDKGITTRTLASGVQVRTNPETHAVTQKAPGGTWYVVKAGTTPAPAPKASAVVTDTKPTTWQAHTVADVVKGGDKRVNGTGTISYNDGTHTVWKDGKIVGYGQTKTTGSASVSTSTGNKPITNPATLATPKPKVSADPAQPAWHQDPTWHASSIGLEEKPGAPGTGNIIVRTVDKNGNGIYEVHHKDGSVTSGGTWNKNEWPGSGASTSVDKPITPPVVTDPVPATAANPVSNDNDPLGLGALSSNPNQHGKAL